MWENTIEQTLTNTRRHSDVISVTYAHLTYFSHVDPKKVVIIGKIAIGVQSLLYFLLLKGILNVGTHNETNSDQYMASQ